jgi:hypothetical protein
LKLQKEGYGEFECIYFEHFESYREINNVRKYTGRDKNGEIEKQILFES